jgi:hypothetical protein
MSIARSTKFLRTALLALAIPAIGLPATVTLAGPTVGPNSAYNATSFNQTVSFGDGDTYDVFGNYFATYTDAGGTNIHINPTVVYTGSSPSAGNDAVSISFTQAFFDSRPGTFDGTYTASTPVNITGGVGAGSSLTAEVFYDGQSIGSATGSSGVLHSSANLTGLTGDTLTGVYNLTYNLNAGTQPGAGISSSTVPEPTEALPLGLGLAGVLYAVARRKKSA